MGQGMNHDTSLITRRQFNRSALLMASTVLFGPPLTLWAGQRSNPDPAPLRRILRQQHSFCARSTSARFLVEYGRAMVKQCAEHGITLL